LAANPPEPSAAQTAALAIASVVPSAQAQVEFRKSGETGLLSPDQCVLEAAEAIGVAIDFSCRVGICGICVVPLIEGAVTMEVEEGLRPEDKARGIILACQAKSAGNLVVDA
jgi:ferredoxin